MKVQSLQTNNLKRNINFGLKIEDERTKNFMLEAKKTAYEEYGKWILDPQKTSQAPTNPALNWIRNMGVLKLLTSAKSPKDEPSLQLGADGYFYIVDKKTKIMTPIDKTINNHRNPKAFELLNELAVHLSSFNKNAKYYELKIKDPFDIDTIFGECANYLKK